MGRDGEEGEYVTSEGESTVEDMAGGFVEEVEDFIYYDFIINV